MPKITDRTDRTLETREATARARSWRPSSMIPDPPEEPGWKWRWVRRSTLGELDASNMSRSMRDGWRPVKWEDYGEKLDLPVNESTSGNVEFGGLILCKIPEEIAEQRNEYFANETRRQMQAVNTNSEFMREADVRSMPAFREHSSEVTVGRERPRHG